jgi:Putative abortive phage resistance protein AbiGi, antitoxin
MSSLHPEILFHFTSKAGLFGILSSNFAVSYSRENIVGKGKSTGFAVPMVSFCDLKLSELKVHMDKYKGYGIGLSKSWANSHGLNPVFYVNKHCAFTSNFIAAVERLHRHLDSIYDFEQHRAASAAYMDILNTYRYIKNYEGDLVRPGKATAPNYRFADEREWRYVPPLNSTKRPFVPLTQIEGDVQKRDLNASISNLQLKFKPEDIRYLIVEKDKERMELINHLESVKMRFSEDTRRRLASRILTADQIRRDI